MNAASFRKNYRTVWISDIHLGTQGCKAEFLLDFLTEVQSETLYLVGDIIDGWRLKKSWYWPESHHEVLKQIMKKAEGDTKVIYVPGNHDEFAREFTGNVFGHIQVEYDIIHETADGKRLLVLHGDEFDVVVRHAKWLAFIGDTAYTAALILNNYYNWLRRRLGYPYWSLSAYLKHKVKNAVAFVGDYEEALAYEGGRRGVDGVVCGHIHHPDKRMIGDVLYCNDGDWVESCTALTEDHEGNLEILHWPSLRPMSVPGKFTPVNTPKAPGRVKAMAKIMSLLRPSEISGLS